MILTPFERLVLRALFAILIWLQGVSEVTDDIDLAIRTSDGQQRANEAQKRQIP